MNILFVYPEYPHTFWSYKHALKFISRKAVFPPLGILTVASMLPEEWNKRLVDLNVRALRDRDIEWADMVFVSAMLVQEKSAKEVISRCRAMGRTIVAGGPAFTTQHEKFGGVDHFVLNEAEVTLPMFLDDLAKGTLKKIYTSGQRPEITKTKPPMWQLINFKDYVTMPLQFSRGCPFNCEFCDIIIMNGRVPRTKAPEQMMAEMQGLYDAGWRKSVFIVDDNFIGNTLHVKRLLKLLIKWQKAHNYPFRLFTEASINLANDRELMRMMSAANFDKVFLGIETPNLGSLKECSKMQNTSVDLAKAVRDIQRNGMQVMGGFIVGFDNDTESVFETQVKFIQKTGIVTAMVGMLNALPQTRLWHRLEAEGRLVGSSSGENTDGTLNFVPKMGKDSLLRGYRKLVRSIYSPKRYYSRINNFLKDYNHTARGSISMREIIAFIRSIWRIGILSRERFLYWKLILKTAIWKREAFPVAVELAIMGMHFSRIAAGLARMQV